MSDKLRATIFILTGVFVATIQDAIVKALQGGYPTWEVVGLRGGLAIPLFLLWAQFAGIKIFQIPKQWSLIAARGMVLFAAYIAFALATATLSLADAAAIYFTMPFFVALLSGYALGEHVPAVRWLAIGIGFCGVIIAARPGSEQFQPAVFLALACAFGYAVGQILARSIKDQAPTLVVATAQSLFYFFGSALVGLIISLVPRSESPTFAALYLPFVWPNANDCLWIGLMAFASCISSTCFTKAYQTAQASFVAPFEYSAMPWSILIGFAWFKDIPSFYMLLGAAVVISAGLFMALGERQSQSSG